ncbi:MAG: RHS repeat-associated core domain-containing protein, partial [Candidatus Omnitrophota bacterium]
YSSRYYDASICRFIQPDTIVPDPNDPQSLNRYSYCRNNPVKYIDPTGHSFMDWLGKIFGFIAGAITGVATANFMVGFQVFNLVDSLYTAGRTGNWGGFGAGVAGGLLGGFVGGAAAGGLSNAFIQGGINFGEGFLIGAAEMGIAGFGSGFFGALGSGANAGDAAKSGGISAGISAMAGGLLEGSYAAGWQDSVHFRDTRADEIKHYQDLKVNNAEAAANYKSAVGYKHMKVELGYSRITSALPDGRGYNHWGIRITDKLDNFSGQWEFDWVGKEFRWNWGKLFAGQELPGAVYFNRTPLSNFDVVGRGVEAITKVFGNIQRNLDENGYILNQHDCRHWALEQLN